MAKKKHEWEPATWYGTDDPEITKQFDTYRIKMRNGFVWLRVTKPEYLKPGPGLDGVKYQFTASFGANSDKSFSGCLPPTSNDLSLYEAQNAAVAEVKRLNRW